MQQLQKIESFNLFYIRDSVIGSKWKYVAGGAACYAALVLVYKACRYRIESYNAFEFNEFAVHGQEIYREVKLKLFAPLQEIESKNPNLAKKKQIRLLEIGIGAGANLDYFPQGTILKAVDKNRLFQKYFDANRNRYPNIISNDLLVAKGEDLSFIMSESIDVVVVTLVLCSVSNMTSVLEEIYRILVPGGRFFFMEHVEEWDLVNHEKRHTKQVWYDRLLFWSILMDGCKLTRNPLPMIRQCGFRDINSEQFYAKIVDFASPHIMGDATK